MTQEQFLNLPQNQQFILGLCESLSSDNWLALMRFGLKELVSDPAFLFELILMEAERRIERRTKTPGSPPLSQTEIASHIFIELNLKIIINEEKKGENNDEK